MLQSVPIASLDQVLEQLPATGVAPCHLDQVEGGGEATLWIYPLKGTLLVQMSLAYTNES